ncbi:hypothetical protein [Zunongwangia sp. HGR-M22]|uniref:hypothetical protein n=1 Tax=Zunongwangia sp. HGR-M22 TaxID=3015168 RepID=UPI0022DE7A02|nr:hypothetical protein [Zunongwangia sp. HGR-M22]WBL25095.1 hypothetical protein PBT91_14475 [Zunongwangia sp. HGR-M22]
MIITSQIPIKNLSQDDLKVMNEAAQFYNNILEHLCHTNNKSQHHIHHSILYGYRRMIAQRFTRRNIPMRNTLNLEVYQAFVAFDSLIYFQDKTDNQLKKVKANKIANEIFRELPQAEDIHSLSINSQMIK